MRFSINVDTLYDSLPFLGKVKRIASAGFDTIEIWSHRGRPMAGLEMLRRELGIGISNFAAHRRGSLADPTDLFVLRGELDTSLEMAERLECPHVTMLSQSLNPNGGAVDPLARSSHAAVDESIATLLGALLEQLPPPEVAAGMHVPTVLLEPRSSKEHAGYRLTSTERGARIVQHVGNPHLKLLFDAHDMAQMGEDVLESAKKFLSVIGYVQIAVTPDASSPGGMRPLLDLLAGVGYTGYVGLECHPNGEDEEMLKRVAETVQPFR